MWKAGLELPSVQFYTSYIVQVFIYGNRDEER